MKVIGIVSVCLAVVGSSVSAAVWNVSDGKWEEASNWDGNTVPSNEIATITSGTARIDSSSGSQVVGPSSGSSAEVTASGALDISGGALHVRTGMFVSYGGAVTVSGGLLQTTNALSFNGAGATLNLSGGHIVVGDAANDAFSLTTGSTLNYSGGELDITGDWNINKTSQNATVLNHIGLIGGGDFNAIDIADSLTPAQLKLNFSLASGSAFNAGDTFVIFEFHSGSWLGSGDNKYFTDSNGNLIQDFDWAKFGDSSEDDSIVTIDGRRFYLDYNFDVSSADASYNIINTGNYDGTSLER